MTTPQPKSSVVLPALPEPEVVRLPGDGEGLSDEAPHIWAWVAHGYDTGMEPYFSAEQMHAYAREAVALALAAQKAVPVGMSVPLEFLQGFRTLAHNWSLDAIPPDYYHGVERDAFKSAYARCGYELVKLRAMLAAAPTEPSTPTEREAEQAEAPSDTYIRAVIDALHENSDPVSVDAAELLQKLATLPPVSKAEPVAPVVKGPAQWIDDPHDIEQGQMLNPEWLKLHGTPQQRAFHGASTTTPPQQPEASGAGERPDAMQISDLIDPLTRKQAPDHLTMAAAAMALRALASKPPAVEQKPVSHIGLSTFAWGVTRMGDNPKAVLVSFRSEPTDDDLRTLHEALRPASGRTVHADSVQPEQVAQDSRITPGVVYVCDINDRECGDRPAGWCSGCPKQRAARTRGDGERA